MTNLEIKQKVRNEIAELRANAINEAEKNKALALSNPEFVLLDKKIRSLTFDISKKEAFNQDISGLKAELKNLNDQKNKVLKSLNLTPESLKPKFSCLICEDRGVTPSGDCVCFTKRLNNLISENADNFASFESFKDFGNEKLLKIKNFIIAWANDEKKLNQLLLSGKTGVGKTFLGECALSQFNRTGKSVLKVSAFRMNELFTKFHTCFDYDRSSFLDPLLYADVLLIDDLGTEPIKRNVTKEYLYLLLNERLNANKKTIITTNLDLEDILRIYEERIFSRLADKKTTKCINIEGTDLRLK